MKERWILLACTFCWCLLPAEMVAQDYHVQHFSTASGLSDDQVSDVHQDRYGYLWVATGHGLNLYNGHEFRIFRYDPEDSFSIRANSLKTLYEDAESNIWVGLSVGGVNKYDRIQDRFSYYTANPERGQDPNNFVQTMLSDSQGRVWIGTSVYINLLNEQTGLYAPVPVEGREEDYVYSLYEDAQSTIWLGSESGLFRFDELQKRFVEIFDEQGKPIKELARYAEDPQGRLWASSSHDVYMLEAARARRVPTPAKRYITNLFQAADGEIFISQYEDHIYQWTSEGWQIPPGFAAPAAGLRYAHADNGSQQIMVADNQRGFLMHDLAKAETRYLAKVDIRLRSFWFGEEARELWLGSPENGLFRVDLQPKIARHLTADDEGQDLPKPVTRLVQRGDDLALFLAGGKLYRLNTGTGQIKSYPVQGLTEPIKTMHSVSDQLLMLLTQKGFTQLDLQGNKLKRLSGLGLADSFEFLVAGDSLWSIGEYGLALTRLNSKQTQYFRDLEYLPEIFKAGEIRTLLLDDQGVMWLGTVREGLVKLWFDRDLGRYVSDSFRYAGVRGPFQSHTVNALLQDSKGRLWVGGFSSGLLEFDRKTNQFINRNAVGEVPIPHINTLLEAGDGSIWLSAKDGVHRFNPDDQSFHQFSKRDGLLEAPFVYRSGASLGKKGIAFGTERGLTLLETAQFALDNAPPKVQLEAFSIENSGLTFRQPITSAPTTFKYHQNFVSFNFLAVHYQNPGQVRYQYRLRGLETEWKTGKQRYVQYANLGPGSYTFEVKAGLEAGIWNEQVTRFEFSIHQPFWWQAWFLMLVGLLLMLAVLVVNKVRMNIKLSRIKALETVRQNAAADFHDEMGNKLTRISLFTEVLEKKLNGTSPEISAYVKKIKDNSHVLNNSMRDFLWALDPDKDTTFDLIVMLKDFGDELFDNSGLAFQVTSIKEVFREYPLDMNWKRHLVMIFKEAMHNALKHSQARTVTLKASLSKDVLNLSLSDDGVGFSQKRRNGGYGHANMRRRAEALGASISVESEEGVGTLVTFIGTLSKKYETYD